ncbi:MAG: hypothetical protein WAP52_01575 [Candidatus Sungiibacteriota bacterium]
MDLLEQYKQQNPEKFREQKSMPMADAYGREYSPMVALVIRLSGGRIKDAKQASYTLLIVTAVIAAISGILFLRLFGIGTGPDTNKIIPIAGPGNETPR